MAVKNRKRGNAGFAFPLPAAVFLSLTVTLLLLYVWLDAHGHALGARIKSLEQQRVELDKRHAYELSKWEMLKSPANIEKALARARLVMVAPESCDVVRLSERKTRDNMGLLAHLGGASGAHMND